MTLFAQMQSAAVPDDDDRRLRPASIDGLQDRVARLECDGFRAGNLHRRVTALERAIKAQILATRRLERDLASIASLLSAWEIK